MRLTRRSFLQIAGATPFALAGRQRRPELPPIRRLTRGPKFHWFGYYDKLQFDPPGRRVLGMEVGFEHRSPTAGDEIGIGFVDLAHDDAWVEVGRSRAWSWQQGCMLQWRPGSASEILWNDRDGDDFVCRVLDVDQKQLRTLPRPVYTLAPDGRTALTVDFRRLQDLRPGYGYPGVADPYRDQPAPEHSGIERIDLVTGAHQQILSIAEVAAKSGATGTHWFNHLLFNPDGSRFVFLHRWRPQPGAGFRTRMLTATADGKDLRVVDPSGNTSHFIWRDRNHILAWSQPKGQKPGFWLFEDSDGGERVEPVGAGVMTENGHCSYLPGGQWILNDTYPDAQRLQHPFLFQVAKGAVVPLGHFASPAAYRGEWRCDTHPRFAPDGKSVVIDSPHGGDGRQLWRIDLSGIV